MPLLVFRDAPTGFPDAPTGFPAKNRPLSVGEAPCLQKKMSLQFWRVAAQLCVCAAVRVRGCRIVCAQLCVLRIVRVLRIRRA